MDSRFEVSGIMGERPEMRGMEWVMLLCHPCPIPALAPSACAPLPNSHPY